MSSKQMKKLIIIIVAFVLVVGGVFAALFFVDFDALAGGGQDIEVVKAEGNYEKLKSDVADAFKTRDSQTAAIADAFFDPAKIGITSYERMSRQEARRGNVAVYADGYKIDAYIIAGDLANAYIGNVLIYKNTKVSSVTVANAPELTFKQYQNSVRSFQKGLDIDDVNVAKDLYAKLTMMDINSFTDIKKTKVNGMSGYRGYEGAMPYFIVLDSSGNMKELYINCEAFEPIKIYDSATATGEETSTTYKILYGSRVAIPTSLEYRVTKAVGQTVKLPAALQSGDDSWLMLKYDGTLYFETRCEVGEPGALKAEDIVMQVQDNATRDIIYLKVAKKVYIENGQPVS